MKRTRVQAPTGMHDVLPDQQKGFQKIQKVCESAANFYGFGKIDTPILEQAEIFLKGVGASTDVIEKEMYILRTKGGDVLALRPEGTASIARAYIEHGMYNLPQPVKLWYWGPFFRHERPQAGRYRQFWQFGFEILGDQSPVIDAQIIQIFYGILKDLKFKNLIVEVNSIGCTHCRSYYKKLLSGYFRSRSASLCQTCRKRLRENPLRILDCKEEKCQRIIRQAPQMIDHLCEECKKHFKDVLEFLDEMDLPYNLNPYLVRGLDYYSKTVFEIFSQPKEKEEDSIKRSALVGGGRYDTLIKRLGGRDVPGCGGAAGIERLSGFEEEGTEMPKSMDYQNPQIFIAQLGDMGKKKGLVLVNKFKEEKIQVAESFSKDSLKTQLGRADKMGARYCLIVGQREALEGTVMVRDMKTGKQETVKMDKVVSEIKRRLKK